MRLSFTLNGSPVSLDVPAATRLLDVLRDDCGLTGTKEGCGKGECGACSVLLDGRLVNSCLVLACQAQGREVLTIEGLEQQGQYHPIQTAFLEAGAVQCGFCMPGMVLAAKALVDEHPHPTDEQIRRGIAGNLCRCTGYAKVIDAVKLYAGTPRRS
ncbi:(2Fe-2S)-binding protein [bacterium]|nr:(2Fe-2S)-binding protein [bacterium]